MKARRGGRGARGVVSRFLDWWRERGEPVVMMWSALRWAEEYELHRARRAMMTRSNRMLLAPVALVASITERVVVLAGLSAGFVAGVLMALCLAFVGRQINRCLSERRRREDEAGLRRRMALRDAAWMRRVRSVGVFRRD